ncbi:AmmeMemoRadiSam system protein A [Teredinibacter haidensis]|uniref:AmmeMemoRadiSam system protein A n=1 Tax=Teredinibacter haidensis TaxID=2731755 RepID=UPI0009490727|nr:AmmeMemoRadiSam system protein A [Teredinibacter haidensis]
MVKPHLGKEQQQMLLAVARKCIIYGCQNRSLLPIDKSLIVQPELQQIVSTFVTLKEADIHNVYQLRGCVGSVTASQSLLSDVIEHAYTAAFYDSRFPEIAADDIPLLHIAISIISPQEELQFKKQDDLLEQLRPHVDGLIIQSRGRLATFLPSVWDLVSDKTGFIEHLKLKAGFTTDYWNDDLKAFRYETLYFEEKTPV